MSDELQRAKTTKQRGLSEAFEPTAPGENGISEGCVLLRAGANKTAQSGRPGGRKYTPDFIREHLPRFEGAMCHMDHPTISEAKDRPERTMGTLAAVVKNPRWSETDNAAVGDLHYLGTDAGRNMREAFADETVRAHAGLSIYWPGGVRVKREKLGESYVDVPVELLGEGQFNVDFVTRPNAGGRVAPLRESEETMEELTVEMLEAERPDLVAKLREGFIPKPAEEKLETQVTVGMSEAERAEFDALKKRARCADAKDIVTAKLAEASLPEKAAGLVLAHFSEAECADAAAFTPLDEAEIERVKGAFEGLVEAGRVRGIGGEPKPKVTGGKSAAELMAAKSDDK